MSIDMGSSIVHWLVGWGRQQNQLQSVYCTEVFCRSHHIQPFLSFYLVYIATTYQSVLYSTPHSIFPILRRISCIKNWKTTSTETEHEFVSH